MAKVLDITPVELKGVEIFRAGLNTDASGRAKTWTPEELKEAADTYNEGIGTHDAPVTIGHDGNTAYAWLERAYVDGDILKADYKDVDPTFATYLKAGRYKKRSVSIYPQNYAFNPTPGKLNLRHVAYVGVPAIKGLKDHEAGTPLFSDGDGADCLTYEFGFYAYSPFQRIGQMFQGLRDRLIAESSVDEAEKQIPQEAIATLMEQPSSFVSLEEFWQVTDRLRERISALEPSNPSTISYGESPMTTEQTPPAAQTPPVTQPAAQPDQSADFAEMRSQLAALQVENANLKTANETQSSRLQAMELSQERARVHAFVEALSGNDRRKVHPADVDTKVQLAMALSGEQTAEFTETNGDRVTMTHRQRFLHDLENGRDLWGTQPTGSAPSNAPNSFGDVQPQNTAVADYDETSISDDAKVRKYMAEKHCSYAEAATQLVASGAIQ